MRPIQNLILILYVSLGPILQARSQESIALNIFEKQPINFGGPSGDTLEARRYDQGRLLFKRIEAPTFRRGTDVKIKLSLRSAGDVWDRAGSVFVIPNPDVVDIEDIAKGVGSYPEASAAVEYKGIKSAENYSLPVELLRFATPFGIGYYSDEEKYPHVRRRRPLYIPEWEDEVTWEADVSQVWEELTGDFLIGVWIDTWTPGGFEIDLTLEYTGRPLKEQKVLPLVNTVNYAKQKLPDIFSYQPVSVEFELAEPVTDAKLYYFATGHGSHRGGDAYTKAPNKIKLDGEPVFDSIPWRSDCASFRRFNPHSGVWMRKETVELRNEKGKMETYTRREEVASSDISRSNWCPGSMVEPYIIELGELPAGLHELIIDIDGAKNSGDKRNHWLVSAYLVY